MALGVFDGLGSREPVWSSLTFVLAGDGTGYRKLVFKLQAFIGFKDFKTLQRHLFQQKEYHIKVDLKKVFAMRFLFQKLFTVFLCAKDFENTSIMETVATV